MTSTNAEAVEYRVGVVGKNRYIIVSSTGDWYVGLDSDNRLKKYGRIDSAKSYYSYTKALDMLERCERAGWNCEIVMYSVTYMPIKVVD